MKTMRKLIFATVLGATITLSAQAATPRTENKTQYEQGRKKQEYKKDEWNKRGPAHYETKKSNFKPGRWEHKGRGDIRHDRNARGGWDNKHTYPQKSHEKQCQHQCHGRK